MKTTMKLMLVLALFCTMTFADDGNQGAGGRNCGGAGQPPCGFAAPGDDEMDTIDLVKAISLEILSKMYRF